jgi:hypothetical protein
MVNANPTAELAAEFSDPKSLETRTASSPPAATQSPRASKSSSNGTPCA